MKNIITLSNHILIWLWKSYFAKMAVASVILQFLLLWIRIGIRSGNHSDAFLPYERILFESGITLLIFASLISIFLIILYHGISMRRNHKPIYTILTLPMPREQVYIAFLLSGFTLVIAFMAFQALLLILWYVPVTSIVNEHSMEVILNLDNGEKFIGMNNSIYNGLFLAFVRDPILRILYPSTLKGLFAIAAIVLTLLNLCYSIIFDLRETKVAYVIFTLLICFSIPNGIIRSLSGASNNTSGITSTPWGDLIFFVLVTIGCIQAIRRGEGGDGK